MSTLHITIPDWVDALVAPYRRLGADDPRLEGNEGGTETANVTADDRARMAVVIELARQNVLQGGGPFGAAVFAGDRLIGAGVNRVLDSGYSIAHAEVLALMAAQQELGEQTRPPSLALVTSAEPCCQCFGAVVWSGIDRLVCGADTTDVEAIGFDEGPKPADWQGCLRARGIEVVEHVMRKQAVVVLQDYKARGGVIYGLRDLSK